MIKKYSNILVIGATNRNLGKTEFISRLILRFPEESITAVKIKTLYPGDKKFHGKDIEPGTKFLVRKENSEGLDDSRRFLAAGAEAVYYIKSPIEMLGSALQYLVDEQNLSGLIIIESNSILEYLEPAGFIMIKGPDPTKYKPSSVQFSHKAGLTIQSDGHKFDQSPEEINIRVDQSEWHLL